MTRLWITVPLAHVGPDDARSGVPLDGGLTDEARREMQRSGVADQAGEDRLTT